VNRICWVSVRDRHGLNRMTMWSGPTREIFVTGLPEGFAANCPSEAELPPGAVVHEMDPGGPDVTVFRVAALAEGK
jgi:hypothetical protein